VAGLNDDFKSDTRADIKDLRTDVGDLQKFKNAIWWIGVAMGIVVGLFGREIAEFLSKLHP